MDVTPIVEILEAMPDGPTITLINIEGDVYLGDLNAPFARDFSEIGDLNAPFGRDFLDVTTIDDNSTNTAVGGNIEGKTQAAEVNRTNVQAPRMAANLPEFLGLKDIPAASPLENTVINANNVFNGGEGSSAIDE